MKTETLTVIYNMLSGHFSTTRTEILTCFPCEKHKEVHTAIEDLKKAGILYSEMVRTELGCFYGICHFIDWEKFNDDMINQSLIN